MASQKEKDIFFYQMANKNRILEMTVEDQMVELCNLRRVLRKAQCELDEKKLVVKGGEVAVEATLRIIEDQQGTLDMPDQEESKGKFDGHGVQEDLDGIREAAKALLENGDVDIQFGRLPSPEQVNTVTGEVLPADDAMVQPRVWGPLDPVGPAA